MLSFFRISKKVSLCRLASAEIVSLNNILAQEFFDHEI